MKSFINHIKKSILLMLTVCSCFFTIGQERFNLRYNSGEYATVLKNVIENENGYMTIGYTGDGESFLKSMVITQFDFQGEAQFHTFTGGPEFSSDNWEFAAENADLFRLNENENAHSGHCRDAEGWAQGYVMKTDNNGDTLDVIRFYSPHFMEVNDFSAFISTQFVTLSSDSAFLVSSNIADEETYNDFMIQKISQEGEILWRYDYATEQDFESNHFIIPNDHGGGLIIAKIDDEFYNNHKIISIDSLGEEEWSYQTDFNFYVGRVKSALLDNGFLICLAATKNGLEPGIIPGVHKLDTTGNLIWRKAFWDNDYDIHWGEQLVKATDGSYVAIGKFKHFDGEDCQTERSWIGKIDENGIRKWVRHYTYLEENCNRHFLYDLQETSDGGFIMCGESKDYIGDSGGEFQEGWLLKLDEYGCLVEGCQLSDNIVELSTTTAYFKAGPVPASDFLNIYQTKALDNSYTYQLHDMNGNLLENFPAADFQTTFMLPVHEYASGTYLLSLMESGKVLQSQKVLFSGF